MEELLIYLLKSAGVLSIFVMVYHFLLRRLTFFKSNRWFLLLGMLASVIFPLIEITQTVYVEQTAPVYIAQQFEMPATMISQTLPQEPLIDSNQLLLMLYVAVSLFFLGKMVVELLSLQRLIRSGKATFKDGFTMVSLSRKVTPFSFFKTICFYKKDQDKAGMDLILQHEKVHAREWHSVDLLLTHLYRAVFWINPLAWMIKRQVGENLEFIADSTAKVQNNTGISYERTLLSSAASHMQPALANNFFTPFIKKRIQMLQKETSKKWNAYKYALILPVIVLFMYSFNVVEKVEYIKKNNEATVSSINAGEPLVFDITAATSQADLDTMKKKINEFSDYDVDFEQAVKEGNLSISISVVFKNPKNDGAIINYPQEFNLKLLVEKEELKIVNEEKGTINKVSRAGLGFEIMKKEFDISSTTTQANLDSYVKQINEFANYKVKLEKSKDEKGNDRLSVSTAFNGKAFNKMVVIPIHDANKGVVFLQVLKNQLKVNEDFSNTTYSIDESAHLKVITEDWTYGKFTQSPQQPILQSDKIQFTIPPTTNEESLERIKKQLKSAHNVDFDYSNLKYKEGKIIRLKIQLDDNRGYKGSQSYSNNIAIPTICINGEIDGNKKSWSMGNCKDQRMSVNIPTMDMDSIFGSIQNLDMTNMNLAMSQMDMDSLQLTLKSLQSELAKMDMEGLSTDLTDRLKEAEEQLRTLDMDSVEYILNSSMSRLQSNMNRMKNDTVWMNNRNVIYKVGNLNFIPNDSINSNDQNLRIYKSNSLSSSFNQSNPPLAIVDGVETKFSALEKLNSNLIKSVSVLKDNAATSIYGAKAKDGVILVETQKGQDSKTANDKAGYLYGDNQTFYFVNLDKENASEIFNRYGIKLLSLPEPIKDGAKGVTNFNSKNVNYKINGKTLIVTDQDGKNVNLGNTKSRSYSTTTSSSSSSFSVTIDEFTEAELEKLKSALNKQDLDFEVRTFRKSGDNVSKLKFDLDGTAYTYEPKNGMKSLTIKVDGKGQTPKVSAVTY